MAEAVRCGWADVGVCHRLAAEEAGLPFLPVRQEGFDLCYPAATEGDPAALRCFQTVGGWLGQGLADLAAILDPACFVIGGGVSEAGELLLDPARTAFERALPGRGHRPLAEIKVAQLGEDAGIVGAADLARESGQTAVFTRRRRRRRRLSRPALGRSYAARVWRSL